MRAGSSSCQELPLSKRGGQLHKLQGVVAVRRIPMRHALKPGHSPGLPTCVELSLSTVDVCHSLLCIPAKIPCLYQPHSATVAPSVRFWKHVQVSWLLVDGASIMFLYPAKLTLWTQVTEDNARDHSKLLEQRTGYAFCLQGEETFWPSAGVELVLASLNRACG